MDFYEARRVHPVMRPKRSARIAHALLTVGPVGALTAVLCACSYSQLEADKVTWTAAGRSHLGLSLSPRETLEAHSVTFHGTWQTEQYTRLQGQGFHAELYLAFTPPHDTVSLDYSMDLEDFVESWRFNQAQPKVWLSAGRFYRRPATFFYRRYRRLEDYRECVGYTANWRPKADDPMFHPSRLSFGYFCLDPGRVLSDAGAASLLRRIEIRLPSDSDQRGKPRGVPPSPMQLGCLQNGASPGYSALDVAQGATPCDIMGNPRFPFKFANYYNITHGVYSR